MTVPTYTSTSNHQRWVKNSQSLVHGAPTQLSKYRLLDMFTGCTDEAVKNQILQSFTKDSCL